MTPIFLIGPRGSGKTTIGKILAARLNYGFIDLDQSLVQTLQATVSDIVDKEGWEGFRNREAAHLREMLERIENTPAMVVATGGGIVLRQENRSLLARKGQVFWLDAPAGQLLGRLTANPLSSQRPSLTGKDPLTEMMEVLAERESLYSACAHHKIDAACDPDAVCQQIVQLLESGTGKY